MWRWWYRRLPIMSRKKKGSFWIQVNVNKKKGKGHHAVVTPAMVGRGGEGDDGQS